MSDAQVRFLDLAGAYGGPVREGALRAIRGVSAAAAFTGGDAVERFEREWAEYNLATYCVGVGSGTDALRIALVAAGIRPGQIVHVPAATFQATWEAVAQAGGRPAGVDVDPLTWLMDLRRTVVVEGDWVVPVHLYGRKLPLEHPWPHVRHRLRIIEDACQSHGVLPLGTSTAACYSFFPTKNLGAWGDAGAIVTDDRELAEKARLLRQHGIAANGSGTPRTPQPGWTSRLDAIQAAVLSAKLPHLDEWNRQREEAAAFYQAELAGVPGLMLPAASGESSWHLYVVRVDRPDELAAFLAGRGVGARRHYPTPPHLTPAFEHLGYGPGDFPEAEALFRECLSLPLYPTLGEAAQELVVRAVRDYLGAP